LKLIGTLGTILKWAVLLPLLLAVVLLAVANDQGVTVHLNPFDTSDPVLRIDLALYQLAFVLFVLGVLIGGVIVWIGQRKYRRQAFNLRSETDTWQARAERPDRRDEEAAPTQAAAFLPRPERS
jgi:hypothetical protein